MSERVCDWHQCQSVAVNHVRVDVPRGDRFTSLMWVRCADHTPDAPMWSGKVVSPLA